MSKSDPTQGSDAPDALTRKLREVVMETETVRFHDPKPTVLVNIRGYQIIRELHRGGQGIVYEALQRSTKRKVAIKILISGRFASPRTRRRFEREIELVAQLKHPHIISIFHSGETREGMQYFVMDYVRGQPLDRFIREHECSVEDTLRLFATICDAVQYAHHRGVIHRDLKPSNILVDIEGVPKVLDFGLAKLMAGPIDTVVSMSQEVIGTLPYMSPEQTCGNPDAVDTRTDVYALGVILYKLLTGCYPYPVAGPISDAMRHIAETEPVPPSRKWTPASGVSDRPGGNHRADKSPIDEDVQTITLKALAKERQRRYQTAGELARDIRHRLAGEPIDAKRDHRWYVFRKTLRRYRVPVAAGLAFVALLIVASVALSISLLRTESARQEATAQRVLADEFRGLAEGRLLLARRHAYASDMLLAQHEWENANVGSVRQYLAAQLPKPGQQDLRGFEWYYLQRLCHSDIATFKENSSVWSVAFSPNGETLAAASGERVVLRNIVSGTVTSLSGHTHNVFSVAFSPDGKLLATGSQDETIRLWDVNRGAEVAQAKVGDIGAVRFSPDGKFLAAVGARYPQKAAIVELRSVPDLTLHIDLAGCDRTVTGEPVYYHVAFSPDGRDLLTGGADGAVRIWDVADGTLRRQFPGHIRQVTALALAPDGHVLATAGEDENVKGVIKLWNAETGEPPTVLARDDQEVKMLAFSPNGRLLVSGGDDRIIRVWDVNTHELKNTVRGHADTILTAAFSPSGTMLATGSYDETYKLWDVQIRQQSLQLRANQKRVNCVAVSPDGRLIASGGEDRTVKLWHADSGALSGTLDGHKYPVHRVAFAPDGKSLVTASKREPFEWSGGRNVAQEVVGELKWWDTQRFTEQASLEFQDDYIDDLAFSADGSTLATSMEYSSAGGLDFWDVASKAKKTSPTLDGLIPDSSGVSLPKYTCLAYSPDGKWLAAGTRDATVSLWNLTTSQEHELPGYVGRIMTVAFGPLSDRLGASCNGARVGSILQPTFKLWDVTTREPIFTRVDAECFKTISFSPLGQTVATSGLYAPVKLWDIHTGQLRWSFDIGLPTEPRSTFSRDGRRLIAAEADTIYIWEADPSAMRN
jgi:WD40 repeat protein/serine/threonine protein kinase